MHVARDTLVLLHQSNTVTTQSISGSKNVDQNDPATLKPSFQKAQDKNKDQTIKPRN